MKKPFSNSPTKFIQVDHLDKIGEVAVYYGFGPIKSPSVTKQDLDAAKDILGDDFVDDETEHHGKLPLGVEEKIALIRTYQDENWIDRAQPVMIYLKDPSRGATKKPGVHRYADLEILGTSGAIAEATLIQAGRAILTEEGYTDTRVEVNSIGDRDSMARFNRELIAYYRKHVNEMSPECRQMLKRDPYELLASREEACMELNSHAPRSMDFLSEGSRRHLEEVLEYLEGLGIPYSINNSLIGNRSYCTETVFTITSGAGAGATKGSQKVYAVGLRYNGLAKRLGVKRDIQGVGMSLLMKGNGGGLRDPLKKVKRPIASFIQLGTQSKQMSLEVIERLRQAKIPLYLALAKDRIGAQVSNIEKFHTPYVIVMGKKEAVEKTAIVRRTDTYSQDTVPLEKLPDYMKKVEKDYWGK